MLAKFLGIERRSQTDRSLFTTSTYDGEWTAWGDPAELALMLPPFWKATSMLSGDLAKLPLLKMVRDEEGRERPQPSHPTWPIVHDRPTPNSGAFKFWRRFWVQLVLWSNAYARIERSFDGTPAGLVLLESAMVHRSIGLDEDAGYFYLDSESQWTFIPASELIHVEEIALQRTSTSEGNLRDKPLWMLDQARLQIAHDHAVNEFGTTFFKRGGRAGGVLEFPPNMSKKSRDNLETDFREIYETQAGTGKAFSARANIKFHQTTVDPDKTQMIESQKHANVEVSQFFQIPAHKLDAEINSGYNSLEAEQENYKDSSLMPRLIALQDECKTKLLRSFERSSGRHFYKHDTRQISEPDAATKMTNASTGYTNNIINQNEARAMVGFEPIEGGDQFLRMLNMTTGTELAEPPADDDQTDEEVEDDAEEDTGQERALALTRPAMVAALTRAVESMHKYIYRQTKNGEQWSGKRSESCRNNWTKTVTPEIDSYAVAAGLPLAELTERLYAASCAGLLGSVVRPSGQFAAELIERIENAAIQ